MADRLHHQDLNKASSFNRAPSFNIASSVESAQADSRNPKTNIVNAQLGRLGNGSFFLTHQHGALPLLHELNIVSTLNGESMSMPPEREWIRSGRMQRKIMTTKVRCSLFATSSAYVHVCIMRTSVGCLYVPWF
jgi:hypothetical protein